MFCLYILLFPLFFSSCKRDHRLDNLVIHENPFVVVKSKPKVLLDKLDNPIAPVFFEERIVFAESGKGIIYEYRKEKVTPLIEGFGLDKYGRYQISVLGIMRIPDKNIWIVAASQDSGHILMFNESSFPTTADKGREIEMLRTEPSNPFEVILVSKGKIIVASGGTKSVYQGNFDVINPGPLKPVFDVVSGVEGMVEDPKTGNIYGAVVGSGKKDGSLIRWDPTANIIQPQTVAEGFSNLIGVIFLPNRLLLLLEFGSFEGSESGRLSVIDPDRPDKSYPLLTGLDSPSGFALSADNTLLISTFGKTPDAQTGMMIELKLEMKN